MTTKYEDLYVSSIVQIKFANRDNCTYFLAETESAIFEFARLEEVFDWIKNNSILPDSETREIRKLCYQKSKAILLRLCMAKKG